MIGISIIHRTAYDDCSASSVIRRFLYAGTGSRQSQGQALSVGPLTLAAAGAGKRIKASDEPQRRQNNEQNTQSG